MNAADRILGTLGHRGWRLKRAWALSRARSWWRADSSRRLMPGPVRGEGEPGPSEREDAGGLASPVRLVSPPPAKEPAGEGIVVAFPGAGREVADTAPENEAPRRP